MNLAVVNIKTGERWEFNTAHKVAIFLLGRDIRNYYVYKDKQRVVLGTPEFGEIEKRIIAAKQQEAEC